MLGGVLSSAHANDTAIESNLSFRRFTTLDALPQMQTETVWQDERGYIYIGTLSGFARYDGRVLTPYLSSRRENIVAFQEVEGKVVAFGFVRKWTRRGKDLVKGQIDPEGGLLLNNFNSPDLPPGYILLEDRQEQNRSLYVFREGAMQRVMESPLLDSMTPDRKMYMDSTGTYVPTPQGLFVMRDGQTIRLTTRQDIFSLIRTKEGLLAFASDGIYGVSKDSLSLRYGHIFTDPDYGLTVREDRHGRLIIADAHTIWRFDPATSTIQQMATGFNLIRCIFIDKWDRLWAATYQGAYCFFHCNFVNHRLTDRNDIVRAVAVSGGHAVCGTLNGKVLMDGRVIAEDSGNYYSPGAAVIGDRVYMAANGDVACVQDGKFRTLGLPPAHYNFVAPGDDGLIVATRSGVFSLDEEGGKLDTLTTEIIRPWCAATDGKGRLFVSGNPGLYCLRGAEGGGTVVRKVKTTSDTQVITAMSSDGMGKVCFARSDSLFVIKDGDIFPLTQTQEVLTGHEIRSVHISSRGYLIAAAIDGLMMARIDDDAVVSDIHWFNSQSGFTTIEPLLSPMAEGEDGKVWLSGLEEMTSFDPESLLADNQEKTIVQAPRPWWQRWWAGLGGAGLLILVVWFITRLIVQRLTRRELERLEREKRQKELQLSAIRLKAIPHFHSNVLAGIEYYVTHNSPDEASRYLKLYSDFTNQTLADIDRPARCVSEEVDYVRSYLELEQLRYGEKLQYNIYVGPGVDENILLPTMLLHTYCENAVKHGIAAKNGPGTVDVSIVHESKGGVEGVLVSVSDDGVGRAQAARSGVPSTKKGLKILQEQIDLYNLTNRHRIVQKVTDLTDESALPAGTRFEMWIPANYQY